MIVVIVLVVCTGNICRSAMGDVVLNAKLAGRDDVRVTSAGVSDEEHGHGIDYRAARVLREAGYDVPAHHRAHRATDQELRDADLILAMTTSHEHVLKQRLERLGSDVTKVHLWREYDGSPEHVVDVPDPWYGDMSDFYETLDVIEAGANGVVAALS